MQSIVSYNYDDLLETAIGERAMPIWSTQQRITGRVPVYHVHGFVPFSTTSQTRSGESEIVFTEDQYFQVAQNPYSWSNVVQIQSMSSTVGLMIGLSLSDRNIRRLLQAVNSTPLKSECYLLMKRRSHPSPSQEDLDEIDLKARELSDRFPGRRTKKERFRYEISEILQAVSERDDEQQIQLLRDMGVHPWWVNDYSEIGKILDQITNGRSSEPIQKDLIRGDNA